MKAVAKLRVFKVKYNHPRRRDNGMGNLIYTQDKDEVCMLNSERGKDGVFTRNGHLILNFTDKKGEKESCRKDKKESIPVCMHEIRKGEEDNKACG